MIYAAPNLAAAVDAFSRQYGVSPVIGGRHLGFGTRNALVGLGERTYLEIVGIDPGQAMPAGSRLFGLAATSTPRFATWCARAPRPLAQTVAIAREAGCDLGEVVPMSRALPDGGSLAWTLTSPFADRDGGVLPFYIEWGRSPHPAASLPAGLSLASLTVLHPAPDRIRAILDALGEHEVEVDASTEPELRVALR